MNSRGQKGGFTLIELLVVIASISVLASLLLPALARAKDKARAVTCLNNLKQWGTAAHLFAADNEDFLPPDGNVTATSSNGWFVDLPRALGIGTYYEMPWRTNKDIDPGNTIWICPANSRRSNGLRLFHYCLNDVYNGTGDDDHQVKLSSIPAPHVLVWMFDNKNLPGVGAANFVHTNLHSHGAQMVFLDGHAARFKNDQYWNFTTDKPITNNPALVWIP